MTPAVAPITGHDLTWRPLRRDDIPAWHRLLQAIAEVDRPAEHHTPEDLADELFQGSWKDPERDTVAGFAADGSVRAFGQVLVQPGDLRTVRAFCWGGVHPEDRGRGIGTTVLAWQEAVARRKVAELGREVPRRAVVYVDEHVAATRRLLERHAFAAARWYIAMSRPLDGDLPEVALDGALRLVPFSEELSEPVRHAHNEAFADHWGSEPRTREAWETAMVGSRWFRPDWSFVVLDGAEVAGYTLASAYEPDWAEQGYTAGWTDLVGVRPAWRGRRVGAALLAASMGAFRRSGMARADLSVDSENAHGALGLYERLGYGPVRRQVAYVKEL